MDEARVTALRESMRLVGQIHAITVRAINGRFTLLVGERRLRARLGMPDSHLRHSTTTIPPGYIAAQLWDELSSIEQAELELEENIRREDLSWQDQAKAIARLNELRQAQSKVNGEFYGASQLAQEVSQRAATVPLTLKIAETKAALAVAKHLHDPDVAGAKTFKEAQKAVDRKIRREQHGEMASAFEAEAARKSPNVLLRGDCYEHMARLPEGSFDCILTDPPYGINADQFGDMADADTTAGGHAYADDEAVFQRVWGEFPEHCLRLLKSKGHVYVFCDPRRFIDLKDGFELGGFEVWPWPLIWSKGGRMLPDAKHGPRRAYECILFANKGRREVECIANDLISIPGVQSPRHGAEKPIGLYRDLLGRSTRPGDRVLDPFCGSGTIFPAANLAKVAATGIEADPTHANLAASRLLEELGGQQVSLLEAF